jgi:hypothetical protein
MVLTGSGQFAKNPQRRYSVDDQAHRVFRPRDSVPLPRRWDGRRGTQLATEPLKLVILGGQDGQKEPVTFLELGELCVSAGEFAGEPLVEIPQPCDAGRAAGLPPRRLPAAFRTRP